MYLISHGFHAYQSDTLLFFHISNGQVIYILVYVDDLVITGTNSNLIQRFIDKLNSVFVLKDLGNLRYFLGIQIQQTSDGLSLNQTGYIKDIIDRTYMSDVAPISTPTDSHSRLVLAGEPFSDPRLYRQVVGFLQYATITRPDIAYMINRVCQYMHSPTTQHW